MACLDVGTGYTDSPCRLSAVRVLVAFRGSIGSGRAGAGAGAFPAPFTLSTCTKPCSKLQLDKQVHTRAQERTLLGCGAHRARLLELVSEGMATRAELRSISRRGALCAQQSVQQAT